MKKKPLEIVVIQGGGRGARHSLVAPHVVLGRLEPMETAGPGSLLFPEPTVSRIHATLDWDESNHRYLLTHRSATNPTTVNKVKVTKPRHVSPGDKIQMGNLIIEVRVGVGQHAELELETVDFTALTKKAADQVYRPETVMPEAPAMPFAEPQAPQEIPAPIPAPIPPPPRRQLPQPVFTEPYAPVEHVPSPLPMVARAEKVPSRQFFEFPEADEQVAPVVELPRRRIQLDSLPMQPAPVPQEVAEPAPPPVEPQSKDPEALDPQPQAPEALESQPEDPEALEPQPQAPEALDTQPQDPEALEPQPEAPEALDTQPQAPEALEPQPQAPESLEPQPEAPEALDPQPQATEALELQPEAPEASTTGPAQAEAELEPVVEEVEPAAPPQEKVKLKPFRRETPKIGRNDKCPCGSGKKYKKCCGR